ncbi:MAG: hypothetical protein WCR52_18980 [Bacteroidota bacterium]
MKPYLTVLLLCCSSVSNLQAQAIYDINFKPLSPFFKNYEIGFEYSPEGRVGLEFDLRCDKNKVQVSEYSSILGGYTGYTLNYDERLNTYKLVAKYYQNSRHNGAGIFYGMFYLNQRYYKPSNTAIQHYKNLYKSDLPKDLSSAVGLITGVKTAYQDWLILEADVALGYNLYHNYATQVFSSNYSSDLNITAFANLKLGIRISKDRKTKKKK